MSGALADLPLDVPVAVPCVAPECGRTIAKPRVGQRFCSAKCRRQFHQAARVPGEAVGTPAMVASVRALQNGTLSIVLHVKGPAAWTASRLRVKQPVRLVE